MSPIPRGSAGRRVAEERLSQRRRAAKRPDGTPLVWVAAATGLGGVVATASSQAGSLAPALACASAALLGWLIAYRRGRDGWACGWLLGAVALLACGWGGAAWRLFRVDEIGRFAARDSEPVCLEAIASALPVVYPAEEHSPFRAIPPEERTVLEVDVVSLRDATTWRDASGRCEITVSGRLAGLRPGDRLRVFGQLRRPSPAMNPGQRDAAARRRADRQLTVVWTEAPECVKRLEGEDDAALGPMAAEARNWSLRQVDRRTGDASPLVRAMLLGDGSTLSETTIEAFRRTGTLHVLVVSGLHVGLVAAVLPSLAALGFVPRRVAWLGALVLVAAYVVIAGARPPAVRAGVVASAACLAALAGRRPLSANSLAGAGVSVFALSPGAWMSVGTQLSFLAAATLLGVASWATRRRACVTPPLERLIHAARSPRQRLTRRAVGWVGWVLAATVAVQVVTGPLVASEFHLVSPAAAPLALVVSPLIAITVGAGVLVLVADAVGLAGVAWLAGKACGLAAGSLGDTVTATAETAWAGFWTPGPEAWWSAAWIGLAALGGAIWAYAPTSPRGRWLALRLGLGLLAVPTGQVLIDTLAPRNELRCSFIAVGHGSSTLIETPDGGAVLIDAGALGAPERVTDMISRVLWSRGLTRLDAVVLTHPDVDHYNALPGLLDRFGIGAVWTTPYMFPAFDVPDDRSGPAELKRLLLAAKIPIREIKQGDRLRAGGARLEVLHPNDLGVIGSDNANSLVLGVEFAGRRVLLPGDLESPGVEAVLAQEPYDCDLLLAPHHGSRLSNPPGFAAWCRPETVLVSSGEARAEAVRAYADAGSRVLSTHRSGLLSVALSKRSVRVSSHRGVNQ